MAKEQAPKRSIADLLSSAPPQTSVRPLTEAEIEATTRKIHHDNKLPQVQVSLDAVQEAPAPPIESPQETRAGFKAQARKSDADDALTRISFDVTISMFVKMKEKALRNHQTMRSYLTQLVEKDLGLQ